MGKKKSDEDFVLSPMPEDLDDFGELLDVVRARVDAQRKAKISQRIGEWEPLFLVNGVYKDPELTSLVMEFSKLIIGAVAALFLILQFWIVAGVLFTIELVLFLVHRRWVKTKVEPMWAFRRSIAVRPIAVGMGSGRLFEGPLDDPEQEQLMSLSGFLVWTEDPELERDPAALHRLSDRVSSLHEHSEEETPEPWRRVRRYVQWVMDGQDGDTGADDFGSPVQLPPGEVGNDRTFVFVSALGFAEMPNGYVDRTILIALQGPGVESGTCILDRTYWWNERADELTRVTSYFDAEELERRYPADGAEDGAEDGADAEGDGVRRSDGESERGSESEAAADGDASREA